ncbi:hypothetical protein [Streptomyces sp. NPDC001851]|uniref:hypothetical protein n=1 Tax=Streptomyces sp. NPDC001851 TaxID=3154529 RepID=UPI00332AAD99
MPFVAPDGTRAVLGRPRGLVARTTERYTAVQQLPSEGQSLAAIGRQLRLDHSTVRSFARAQSLDELLLRATNRASIVDEYRPYLHERWREGCHDIPQLHHELRARGFTGSIQCLRRYFQPFKKPHSPKPKIPPAPPPQPQPAPKPRRVVRWIMTNPGRLTETDAAELKEIRAACPHLDATAGHVRDFAAMMRDLRGDDLPAWTDRVLSDDLPALHSLVNGMERDRLVLEMFAGPLPGIYDATGPGKLLFAFFAAMAETERETSGSPRSNGSTPPPARRVRRPARDITDDMLHTVLRRRALGEPVEQSHPPTCGKPAWVRWPT